VPGSNPVWQLKETGGVEYYELTPEPGLVLAFFGRRGGVSKKPYDSLNLSSRVGDDEEHVKENRLRVRRALRLLAVFILRQTHSDAVVRAADARIPAETVEGDASYTHLPGLGLGVTVADCLPVYVYARDLRCVGIAHCGWRGTVSRIAENLARSMSRRFSVRLPDLTFALGPCICPSCYEVGEDVRRQFAAGFPGHETFFPVKGASQPRLDLRAANRWLLRDLGLAEAPSLDLCTKENVGICYSARRDSPTGRNLALIAAHRGGTTRQVGGPNSRGGSRRPCSESGVPQWPPCISAQVDPGRHDCVPLGDQD